MGLEQETAVLDVNALFKAAARRAQDHAAQDRPTYPDPTRRAATGWYRELMGTQVPPPSPTWTGGQPWRYTRSGLADGAVQASTCTPSAGTRQPPAPSAGTCNARRQDACYAGRRRIPSGHVLLTSPGLMGVRLRIPAIGNILPTPDEVRRSDAVAALVAAFRALQSRQATPRDCPRPEGETTTTTSQSPHSGTDRRAAGSLTDSSLSVV